MPKSMITASAGLPPFRMMLSGDRSRWMMLRLCAATRPSATRAADRQQVVGGHRAFAQLLIKARAIDIVHHEIDMAIRGAVVFRIAHDGVVANIADRLLPRHEQQEVGVAGEFRLQNLQRDDTARDLGTCAIDLGRAAAAQQRLDPVGVVEQITRLEGVGGARSAVHAACRRRSPPALFIGSAERLEFDAPVLFAARIVLVEQEVGADADGFQPVLCDPAVPHKVALHFLRAQKR
jgi:hypothetical protein